MRIVAFVGPSLPDEDRRAWPEVEWRPPAEAGDLLRLLPNPPERVCLIDGYFDHRPAVRHKEILWLLSKGVRIFGAASMGALRAAEMAPVGMIGVGAIYRAYARGSLTGDDEVALIHGMEGIGWRALSLPLVNVRATLCRALRLRLVRPSDARAILLSATSIHYSYRCWENVLADLRFLSLERFRAWARNEVIDQKRLDALDCIRHALTDANTPGPASISVRTAFLQALAADCQVTL